MWDLGWSGVELGGVRWGGIEVVWGGEQAQGRRGEQVRRYVVEGVLHQHILEGISRARRWRHLRGYVVDGVLHEQVTDGPRGAGLEQAWRPTGSRLGAGRRPTLTHSSLCCIRGPQ